MSASAKFLLEFQATGDQEVVNKIREVGAAGKETAADLQELQHVEDPFAAIGTGAEGAVGPVTELGGAAVTSAGQLNEIGTATETAATSTMGFGESVTTASGSIAAIGGTIGSTISTLFRYNDIQLRVQKSQLSAAKAAETYRKSEEGIDKILASASGNTDALAAARDRLSKAQADVNKLMSEGVTSGADYEAATSELQAAQAGLAKSAGAAGVDVSKLTSAMEKSELAAGKNVIQQQNLDKTNREAAQGVLELGLNVVGTAGSIVQGISAGKNFKDALVGMKTGILDTIIPLTAMAGGVKGVTAAIGGPLLAALAAAYGAFIVFESVPQLFSTISAAATKDVKKTAEETLKLWEILRQGSQVIPGVGGVYDLLIPKLKEYVAEATNVKDTTEQTTPAFYDLEGRAKAAADNFLKAIKPAGDLQGAILGTGEAAETTNEKFGSMNIGAEESTVMTEEAKAAWEKLSGTLTASVGPMENIEEARKKDTDAYLEWSKQAGNAGILLKGEATLTKATADEMENRTAKIAAANSATATMGGTLRMVNGELTRQVSGMKAAASATGDLSGTIGLVTNAIDDENMRLSQQKYTLEAAAKATADQGVQQKRLAIAYQEGAAAANEWIAGLDEAAAREQTEIAILQQYADQFGQLPDSIQPTVENLHAFIEANEKGGQAAIDFGQKALDAYGQMVEGAKGFLDSLTEAFHESGDEQVDAINTAYEELLPGVQSTLSGMEQTALESFANMHAEIERGQQAFAANLQASWAQGMNMEEALDNSRGALQGFLQAARSEVDEGWTDVFDSAERIATNGSQQMIQAMLTALKSDAPKEEVLAQLKKIEAEGPGIGERTGTGIGQGLTPAAGEAGKGAGIALSEEFAAAGTHIARVIEGIKTNLAKIGGSAKGAAKGINVGIYYRYYIVGKPPQPKPINLGIYYRHYVVTAPPKPPHIQRGIYYRYYVVGSRPNPPNLQRTITYRYRTVGTRPAQMGMHENLAQDTLIAAHRGERVDITPGTVSSNENRTAIIPASGQASRPININVRGDINGKELIRFVRFNFMEGTGGVM